MALTIKTNKCCYFYDSNLPVGAAIPLFTVTKNKDFTTKSCFTTDGIVLAELLKSVGLGITLDVNASSSSLQKVCKENCELLVCFSRTRGYCESRDRKQFAICKTLHEEGKGYSPRIKQENPYLN